MARLAALFAVLFATTAAAAQNASPSQGYLVRMQRVTPYEDVCALISTDGSYRLEETHEKRVYVGTLLGGPSFSRLKEVVADAALRALTQAHIEVPLVQPSSYENVQVTVARADGWQDLRFRAPESRKPVKQQTDFLLDLLSEMRKAPKARLTESDANNCTPQPAAVPARATATTTVAASTAPRNIVVQPLVSIHLRRVGSDLRSAQAIAQRRCLLVAETGHYRYEKSEQVFGAKVQGRALQGMLPPDAIQELRTIMNAPELANAKSGEWEKVTYTGESENIDVVITRPDGQQVVQTFTATGVSHLDGKKQLGMTYRNYSFGPTKELKPLLSWFKTVEKRKGEEVRNPVLNDCKSVTGELP